MSLGAQAFRRMRMEPSDVVMASYPKCGTSWVHQIIFCLLRMDERGRFRPGDSLLGSQGQVSDGTQRRQLGGRLLMMIGTG
jgi:hypothetical protein